tara:strand:+ start:1492 stop:2481 length:990 start_codon:yes stop_codon:yes gene_type:complete
MATNYKFFNTEEKFELKNKKDTCAALYHHTNLRSDNRIYPCCRYKTQLQTFDGDVDAILHSDQYNKLRESWTIDDPNCAKCKYEEQQIGKTSLRESFNESYDVDNVELHDMEIGFDNICDLACDGCWEDRSSTWWVKKNPGKSPKLGVMHSKELTNIPQTIQSVSFLGGEPLMTNRHRKFLESFDDLSNLDVTYFTNGMHKLIPRDIELMDQCKRIKFFFSIDAVGKLGEQVRSGSKWEVVEETIAQISPLYESQIHSTIHINNWRGLPDLAQWTKQYDKWSFNILTYPKHLDIVNLTDKDKEEFVYILDNNDIPMTNWLKKHLKGEKQ